jgi:hypothetical protein
MPTQGTERSGVGWEETKEDRPLQQESRYVLDRAAFDHVGAIATTPANGEVFNEAWRCWTTNPLDHPAYVEWCRFAPESPAPEALQTQPHIGVRVADLRAAIHGHDVLVEPFHNGIAATVAFVIIDGLIVEFLQYDDPTRDGAGGRQR